MTNSPTGGKWAVWQTGGMFTINIRINSPDTNDTNRNIFQLTENSKTYKFYSLLFLDLVILLAVIAESISFGKIVLG